jgi:Transcriptional regulator, AbiEi antitoxin
MKGSEGRKPAMKGVSLRESRLVGLMARKGGTVDELIARIASRSHGVVTRGELLREGVTIHELRTRLERGALLPLHRGVYRVGHRAPSQEARYIAAVKACGEGAVLGGRAAGHLWRLIKGSAPRPEVLTPANRRVRGVIVRRTRRTAVERVVRFGIPITTVPRTLVDLASSLPEDALARACHEAGVLYRATPKQVDTVLQRLPSARGRAKLERVLHGEVPVTLSNLESQFLKLVKEAGLPPPVTNRVASGRRVDCRWPEHRLTVELDSYRFHNSRHAWDQDRLREREARARGDDCRRYAWSDVFEDPALMLAELRELLAAQPSHL